MIPIDNKPQYIYNKNNTIVNNNAIDPVISKLFCSIVPAPVNATPASSMENREISVLSSIWEFINDLLMAILALFSSKIVENDPQLSESVADAVAGAVIDYLIPEEGKSTEQQIKSDLEIKIQKELAEFMNPFLEKQKSLVIPELNKAVKNGSTPKEWFISKCEESSPQPPIVACALSYANLKAIEQTFPEITEVKETLKILSDSLKIEIRKLAKSQLHGSLDPQVQPQ